MSGGDMQNSPIRAADEASGLAEIVGRDEGTESMVRLSMRMFSRQDGVSPRLRTLVEQMLEGRASMRDVMADPEFDAIISGRLDNAAKAVERLPEDQRPSAALFADRLAEGQEPATDNQLTALLRHADPTGARLAARDEARQRGDDDGDLSGWFTTRH